ncbi:MAG TPA: RNA 2',3'-cyclic phosphodiesterase [Conexibacter sp.]|nr:RNA 2',3'-cyclic phosphodiesterase [Conexibacter sp.]
MTGAAGPPPVADAPARARLFVALELPAPVVSALVAWRTPLLRELPALRPVAREALHATLCFIGWRDEEAIAPIAALVAGCARRRGGVAGLALGAPLWLPRRQPRVLALALEDRHGLLAALQAQVVGALADGGWHEPEARPYLPHVTVARVRAGESVPRRMELPAAPALAFDGAAVVLYRSRLARAGARYEPLSVSRLA